MRTVHFRYWRASLFWRGPYYGPFRYPVLACGADFHARKIAPRDEQGRLQIALVVTDDPARVTCKRCLHSSALTSYGSLYSHETPGWLARALL